MEHQQFILRWHYHETTLLKNLPQLLESEMLTDITLSAENQVLKAHRIVLATCSPYFLQLFQNMGCLQHPVVILHNTTFNDLQCLVSFIYKGHCLITKNQLPGLLSLAKLLQVQGLCDMKIPQEMLDASVSSQISSVPKKALGKHGDEEFVKMQENHPIHYELIEFSRSRSKDNEPVYPKAAAQAEVIPDTSTSRKSPKDLLYKCFVCGKYLSNQYNLRVHLETHEEGCFVCHSCPHVSRSRDALRKHVSYRHQEQYNVKKRKKGENTG